MAASTHFKLGLFTLLVSAGALVAAFALGARGIRHDVVAYHIYFDESVQGLDVGAPVKFRGVTIGSVSAIGIAPDQRHVHVVASVDVRELVRSGLADADLVKMGERPGLPSSADLRAQLGTQGITGVKFVNVDYVDVSRYPTQSLPFDPPENTIPAAPSMFKELEDQLMSVVAALPRITARTEVMVDGIAATVASLRKEDLPLRAGRALDNVDGAVTDSRKIIKQLEGQNLPAHAALVLRRLNLALTNVDGLLVEIAKEDGLLASAKRTVDTVGDVADDARETPTELDRALRDLSSAARAVRELAESLERDPDMLIKGRSPGAEQ